MICNSEAQHIAVPRVVLFTVDTEPDRQWFDHHITTTENVHCLPRLQQLLSELELVPTYLVTFSVATDPSAIAVLQQLQRGYGCEIGAHLHVWDTPPFDSENWYSEFPAFAQDLPLDLVHAKLLRLTQAVTDAFGPPTSYRAGRFGFSAEHIPLLEQIGYLVDSSVTPLINRSAKEGVPISYGGRGGRDYRRAPLEPYHPDYADDLKPGSARLLEVPLTVGLSRKATPWSMAVHRSAPELVQRVMRKLGLSEVISAAPVHHSEEQLQTMLEHAIESGRRVFNFTMHSSETMPGASPSIHSEEDVQRLFDRIRRTMLWLRERIPFVSTGLSALALPAEQPGSVAWQPAEQART